MGNLEQTSGSKRATQAVPLPTMGALKDILDKLVVDCGEEYLKLHAGQQGFPHSNNRMDYYEKEAMKQIVNLFPATKTVRLPAVNHPTPDYDRGYNSGYIAAQRSKRKEWQNHGE